MIFKKSFKHFSLHALACVSTAMLAACGGGGGTGASPGQSATSATSSTSPSTASSATPATTTTIASGNDVSGPYGQDASAYTLTFSDEFSNGYDNSVWNDHTWYQASNATKNYAVEDGVLKIWPQRDSSGNFFNRSIDTDGHYTQTYGYFEIEAKLPVGKGTWPAFWLFNHIGARRPEIDIMEAYAGGTSPWGTMIDGQPHPTMYAATIWKDASSQGGSQKVSTPDLSAGFHKYALKWEKNKQTFYFDGREVYSANVTMSDPMYLMLDLWFGSSSGQPDGSTPTGKNNAYEVNYIRAWQFK